MTRIEALSLHDHTIAVVNRSRDDGAGCRRRSERTLVAARKCIALHPCQPGCIEHCRRHLDEAHLHEGNVIHDRIGRNSHLLVDEGPVDEVDCGARSDRERPHGDCIRGSANRHPDRLIRGNLFISERRAEIQKHRSGGDSTGIGRRINPPKLSAVTKRIDRRDDE